MPNFLPFSGSIKVKKIELEAIFLGISKVPTVENLDVWVKVHFAQKVFFWEITDYTVASF